MDSPSFPSSAASSRSSSPSPSAQYPNSTIYFAYGTDLWHHQLLARCPSAKFLGIGRIRHWRFQINSKGYANIVESPMPEEYDAATLRWLGPLMGSQGDPRLDNDRAYGAVWAIGEEEEKKLDVLERVGECYTKEESWVEYWAAQSDGHGHYSPVSLLKRPKKIKAMFHVDRKNTEDATEGKGCTKEYAYRINQAVIDALATGVPQGYVDKCIKPFLPQTDGTADEELIKKGMRDAVRLGIDVRKLVEQVENELALNGPVMEEMELDEESVLKRLLREMAPQRDSESSQMENARRKALASGF